MLVHSSLPRGYLSMVLSTACMLTACGGGGGGNTHHSEQASTPASPQVDPATAQPNPPSPITPPTSSTPSAQDVRNGQFAPAVPWPVIAIHAVVLPDGRVMTYGKGDTRDGEDGKLRYAVWDPRLGTSAEAHLVLPKSTDTNVFCAGQLLIPSSGEVLFSGGDQTLDGLTALGTANIELFDWRTNQMRLDAYQMSARRWYPTLVTLASGDILVLGGYDSPKSAGSPGLYSPTPELYSPTQGWRTLVGATNDVAYGSNNWNYPKSWQSPISSEVFVQTYDGQMFMVDATTAQGSTRPLNTKAALGDPYLPAVMFEPGRILHLARGAKAQVVDIRSMTPDVRDVAGPSQDRYHANATLMADGKVFVNGGAQVWDWNNNTATVVSYTAEIWDPSTQRWSPAASATRQRLYHSSSLLLPDGRIWTAGGGSPGPVKNFDAEIYTPAYLYKQDSSGQLAPRPRIVQAHDQMTWNSVTRLKLDSATKISRVTLIKTGSVTHANNFDQRFLPLQFQQQGDELTLQTPSNALEATPGFYMIFVFDEAGVPSEAKMVRLI